jgi:4-azaleucine resistance transporter AzlC
MRSRPNREDSTTSNDDRKGLKSFSSSGTLREGFKAAWPICVGYLPLGFAFGVLAQKAGLGPLDIALMSILVYAGSSQFIAVAMLSSAAAPLSIILTTFIVNLRHFLMSSSLAVYLHGESRGFLSLFAYGVTDESFAINLAKFKEGGWHRYQALAVNQISNLAWIGSTILGGYAGQFVLAGSLGIDYALSAMFLCLLTFQLRGKIYLLTAVISGATAIAISLIIPGNSFVIISSIIGATTGFALKRYAKRREGDYA